MRIREATVLAAQPEGVWGVLTDWERQAEWMPDVVWIKVLEQERGLGARLCVRTRVFGIPAAMDLVTVTGWEPPRRLAIDHTGMVKGAGEWLLEPAGAGTHFTWIESLRMPPRVLGELALLCYAPWQRWMLRRSIRNLTRLVRTG